MKIVKILSALAIFNLLMVAAISNMLMPKITLQTNSDLVAILSPTPQIVIKKVITKAYRVIEPEAQPSNQVTIPTSSPQSNPSPTLTSVQPTVQNRCIVVIDGVSYDVTDFRNIHSGGNIFTCGSDMSAIFWNQHNASILSRMQKYRI